MRRWFVWAFLGLVMVVILGRFFWQRWRGVAVVLTAVEAGRVVEAVYATGWVDSDQRAIVRARRTGILLRLEVGPGDEVKQGQVVARQEDAEGQLELAKRQQELAAAQAALAEAQDAASRAERLYLLGLLPEKDWVSQRERARELEKRAKALEEAVFLAQEQLRWCVLQAPLSGTVVNLFHRPGDLVREGDEILSVVNLSQAYLRVAVDERDLGKLQPNQEARVVLDAYPQQVFVGKVRRIIPAVDRLTRSTDVVVDLPSEVPALQLDMTATVNIVVGVYEQAILVPRLALLGSGPKRQVLQLDSQGRLAARTVEVGSCDVQRCQIVAGLQLGEQVVADATGLQPGVKAHQR